MAQGHNLILTGRSGRDKTHLVTASACKTIQDGFGAFFASVAGSRVGCHGASTWPLSGGLEIDTPRTVSTRPAAAQHLSPRSWDSHHPGHRASRKSLKRLPVDSYSLLIESLAGPRVPFGCSSVKE